MGGGPLERRLGLAAGTREDAGVSDAQVTVLQAGALPTSLGEASQMDVLRALFPVPMNRALGLCNEEHAKLHPFKPWPITQHELVKFMGVL